MSRRPQPKNTLSAGRRAAIYEEEVKRRNASLSGEEQFNNSDTVSLAQKKPQATMPKKEKPQAVSVRADFSITGRPHAQLHGICNGPLSEMTDISPLFHSLKIPNIRLDRVNGGLGYVLDISKIFPNFSADEAQKESYMFRPTDKYVLAAVNTGAKIIFRLGESFTDNTPEDLLTLPENYDKITRICVNIIKHYNDYWCGGFALGIKYFEIFPRADIQAVQDKNTKDHIFELYSRIACGIKLYDEHLRVGGMSFSRFGTFVRDFVKYCQKKNTPLDFLSVSIYCDTPENMGHELEQYIKLIKNSDYSNAEIIVSEWAYDPSLDGKSTLPLMYSHDCTKADARRELCEKKRSVIGASFIISSLIKMLSYHEISAACLYSGEAGSLFCDISDVFGSPQKPYFAIDAFAKTVRTNNSVFCHVEEKENTLHSGVYAISSSNESEAYVLLSSFDGVTSIDLRLDNIPDNFYSADIFMLDGVKNMDTPYTIELSGMRKRMVLNVSPYSVVFVKLY